MDFSENKRATEKRFTAKEAANLLGFSRTTLWRLVKRGRIRCYRFTKRPTFGQHHLEEFLTSSEQRA